MKEKIRKQEISQMDFQIDIFRTTSEGPNRRKLSYNQDNEDLFPKSIPKFNENREENNNVS